LLAGIEESLARQRHEAACLRRELSRAKDARWLRVVPEGWTGLGEPYDDDFSFARNYLPLGARPKLFQLRALEALIAGNSALIMAPCGHGKSLPPALYAAATAQAALASGRRKICVWLTPTQLLAADTARDLCARYSEEVWDGKGGRFAAVVEASRKRPREGKEPRGLAFPRRASRGGFRRVRFLRKVGRAAIFFPRRRRGTGHQIRRPGRLRRRRRRPRGPAPAARVDRARPAPTRCLGNDAGDARARGSVGHAR